ncbi:MAG TPA: hypothetical protein VML91_25220 [Burkholderiales bacterium]|nr:hypothetical protein [Burkholderiales bacterium]
MANTREDVSAAIRAAFPHSDETTILEVLDLCGTEPHGQSRELIQLAIIALSEGDEDKLLYFVQCAKTDWRDVLHWHQTGPLAPEEGERLQQEIRRLIKRWGDQ